ncbi:MMPL family transporter [Pseudolysinimonas sp.]|uniref:MMPL family transporter n=1 Tax=Pseudolysinimonas sp. TaxID=2680009 RepID=UPI00286D2B65|nr:MMPL family transporter [Pseudolysinimonas sp.]
MTRTDRPAGALGRIAEASARHPFRTLTAWVVILGSAIALAIVGVTGEDLFDRLGSDGGSWSNGESAEADQLLDGTAAETVTLLVYGVDPADPELAGIVADLGERVEEIPGAALVNPLLLPLLPDGSRDPRVAGLFADDGDGVLLVGSVSTTEYVGDFGATLDEVTAELRSAAAEIRDAVPGSVAEAGSADLLVESIIETSESDLQRGEAVALPIALLVMLVVFGGFLAAGIPLIGAIVSIVGGLGALFGFTYLLDVNTTVVNVVTAVGLGLSIDYGLLIVSRFREEYRQSDDAGQRTRDHRIAAIVRTAGSAGRTVAYSGTTFAIAGLGLLFFEPAIVKAIGLGAIAVTVISIASALTLVPALLELGGERLVRPGALTRIPGIGRLLRRFGDIAPDEGFFSKLTRRLQRHPAIVTLAAFAVLLILAAPVLSLRLANTAVDSTPASSDQYTFVTTLNEQFPHAADPRVSLVTRSEEDALAWSRDVERLDAVESVGAPVAVNDVWQTPVVVDGKSGGSVVREIRADAPDFPHWVTGADARTVDFSNALGSGIPAAVVVIAFGTVLLLFLMTGSLVIPLKALLASALSLGASIGLLVWGFQDGAFAGLMGFDPATVYGVDTLVVLLTFVFGFGLAMDYEMFILSRITDQKNAGASDLEAIALGLQHSGRIITSAALIIIVVFAGFATGDLMIIKQLGVALAFAVLLDATLVRCILVPAFMTWQRRIMWWAPRWMKRLHARFGLSD